MWGYVRVTICRQYEGSVRISWYPVIAVLKTTSPVVLPLAPTETPRNTVPSSRASTAGVDTSGFLSSPSQERVPHMCKAGGAPSERPPALKIRSRLFRARILTMPALTVHALVAKASLLKTEHVFHAVKSGRTARQPCRGEKCAAREHPPV